MAPRLDMVVDMVGAGAGAETDMQVGVETEAEGKRLVCFSSL